MYRILEKKGNYIRGYRKGTMNEIAEQMNHLAEFIGREVEIEYVNYGDLRRDTGELREVAPFLNVLVGCQGIPFIGYGSAVRRIALGDDLIYFNPHILDDYDIRNDEEARYAIVAASFGVEIADQRRAEKQKADADWKTRMEEADAEARAKGPTLIEGGASLVKPELAEEWREYARKNTDDSAAVIEGTVQALQALSEGKTPQEAEKTASAAETGFQMGCVAKGLSHFAPRGDEFRAYWNRQYMTEEQAAKADESGGVVNPAVLTIGR